MKTFPLLAVLLLLCCSRLPAVTLAWNASPTPDVQYRIKWGFASGPENQTHVVEAGTALMITIDEPWAPGTTVYFTAYAWSDGGESRPSNEVSYTVPLPGPTPSPSPAPPEPPSNLRLLLQAVFNWLRDLFS